jgi:hypothetical protein
MYNEAVIKDLLRETKQVLASHSISLENLKENILYTNKTLREIKAILTKKKK